MYWGGGWLYGVNPIPVGDQQFLCGAGANFGTYCDKTNDANIHGVHPPGRSRADDPVPELHGTAAAGALDAVPPYQLSMIKKTLKGVTQSPILSLTPEDWSFSN